MKRNLVKENYDPRDEEYVPEFDEGPEYGEEIDPEYLSGSGEKFVIVGTSHWGKEIIDYADSPEEAEELVDKYKDSYGGEWEIEWMHEEDVDFEEAEEYMEDDDYEEEDDMEDWIDPAGGVHRWNEEDPAKMYESIRMERLK